MDRSAARENLNETHVNPASEVLTPAPAAQAKVTIPNGAISKIVTATDFVEAAQKLAAAYSGAFGPGAAGNPDMDKFMADTSPLAADLVTKAAAAGSPIREEIVEQLAAGKNDPAVYRQAILAMAAQANTEAGHLQPAALVAAVRDELVTALTGNRAITEKKAGAWQALGFGEQEAKDYYKYLLTALRTVTEGFDTKYTPSDEGKKVMDRVKRMDTIDIDEVQSFSTVAMLVKELHKKAEVILAEKAAPVAPVKNEVEAANQDKAAAQAGEVKAEPEKKDVSDQPAVQSEPVAAPQVRTPSPEALAFRQAVSEEIKSAVDGLDALTFDHDKQCGEVLQIGAAALSRFDELALLVESSEAPKSFAHARRTRSDVAAIAASISESAAECAGAAQAHFGDDASPVAAALEKLTHKSAEMVQKYEETLKGQMEAELAKVTNAAAASTATPSIGQPAAEVSEFSTQAQEDLRAAMTALHAPEEARCQAIAVEIDEVIGLHDAVREKMGTLKDAKDRDAVLGVMNGVVNAVDAFEDRKAELLEKIKAAFAEESQKEGATQVIAALDKLDTELEKETASFLTRAPLRFRAAGRANKTMADEPVSDPQAVAALVQETREQATQGLTKISAPHAEKCHNAVQSAWGLVGELGKLSGMSATPEKGESIEAMVVRGAAVGVIGQALAKKAEAGLDSLSSAFAEDKYAAGSGKIRAVIEGVRDRANEIATSSTVDTRDKVWKAVTAPVSREELTGVPAGIADAVARWNRTLASTDAQFAKVQAGKDAAAGTLVISKPNLKDGQWTDMIVKDGRLTLVAAAVGTMGRAQMSFEIKNESEMRRYVEGFLRDTTARSGASVNVAGSGLVASLLKDPEVRAHSLQNARVKGENWQTVLPALSGATLSGVLLEDIDARGARASNLTLRNVAVRRMDNAFGSMELNCQGRCDLSDRSNRWGNALSVDLGKSGAIAGNAQYTKLDIRGEAVEYVKRASELKQEIAQAEREMKELKDKLALKAEAEKGIFTRVRENGGLLSVRGWWNGIAAYRSARATFADKGASEDYAKIEERLNELTEKSKQMQSELELSNKEVKARLGNLIFTVKKNDQDIRPFTADLTAEERKSANAQRGSFGDLKEVLKSRVERGTSLMQGDHTIKVARNGVTLVIDQFANRKGEDTGYVTFQIVRSDGTRQPINLGGSPRDMIRVRTETALKVIDSFITCTPEKQAEMLRKLYFAKSTKRDVRRVQTNEEQAVEG